MRWLRVSALVLAVAAATLPAHGSGLLPDLDTTTPRATYETFLAEMQRIEGLYRTYLQEPTNAHQLGLLREMRRAALRLFDVGDLPPALRDKHALAAMGYLADILLRLPPIPPDTIPGTPPTAAADLPAHWTLPGTEIRMQRLTEGSWSGSYVFTAETRARLSEFHAAIIDEPVLRSSSVSSWRHVQQHFVGPLLVHLPLASLPVPLQTLVLGTPLWKALLALLVAVVVGGTVTLAARLVRRSAANASEWRRRAAWLSVPLLLALLTIGAEFVLAWQVGLGGEFFDATAVLTALVLYGAAAWAAWLLCHLVVELIIVLPAIPDNSFDAHLLRLLARVTAVALLVVLMVHGASAVGVPALGLLAGVSVGGIALALAAQSTVENLFGGISIFADRPFRVGDSIRGGAVAGTVERVGVRSSRIRGADSTLTTVPNGDLAKMQITNVSARKYFLFKHLVRLGGESSYPQVQRLLERLRNYIAMHPRISHDPGQPRVRLVGFGDASIDIEVLAQVQVGTTAAFLEVQEELLIEIMRAVQDGGMRLMIAPQPATTATVSPGVTAAAEVPMRSVALGWSPVPTPIERKPDA